MMEKNGQNIQLQNFPEDITNAVHLTTEKIEIS